MKILDEATLDNIVDKSKNDDTEYSPGNRAYGKNRYKRRLKSKVANSVQELNSINMDKFFKLNILDINLKIFGETKDYTVRVSIPNVLDELNLESQNMTTDQRLKLRQFNNAINNALKKNDVYVHCDCPDWQFRMDYWAHSNKLCALPKYDDDPLNRPPVKTNPNGATGPVCKHVLLVLNNKEWIYSVASVIKNYMNYMEKYEEDKFSRLMYPAVYNNVYPKQTSFYDNEIDTTDDTLATDADTDIIDTANKYARTKNQFQPGNQTGIRFTSNKQPDLD